MPEVVNDRPKPMAEISSQPFLDILIDYISSFGFKRVILSVGYMADYIKNYYRNKRGSKKLWQRKAET